MSTTPLDLRLTYRGVITTIAEAAPAEGGYQRIQDLPPLSLEALAATLRYYPSVFIDAMAEYDTTLRTEIPELLEHPGPASDRYGLIGLQVVGFVARYLLPLILRDVQLRCERHREADAIERDSHSRSREVMTSDQLMACELGVGRLLS